MSDKIITGQKLLTEICEKLGLDKHPIHRIVIDIPANDVVMVYIERYGTAALLDVGWSLDGIQIKTVGKA